MQYETAQDSPWSLQKIRKCKSTKKLNNQNTQTQEKCVSLHGWLPTSQHEAQSNIPMGAARRNILQWNQTKQKTPSWKIAWRANLCLSNHKCIKRTTKETRTKHYHLISMIILADTGTKSQNCRQWFTWLFSATNLNGFELPRLLAIWKHLMCNNE